MPGRSRLLPVFACLGALTLCAQAADRFPRPDFTTDYAPPALATPAPLPAWTGWLDILLLVAALALADHFALRRRSRRALGLLAVVCVAYFGFWRHGCVCSVGALQNVAQSLADPATMIPATVLAFFAIPLVWTLFSGRTFCAAVCPLGAVQELVLWRPLSIPFWLDRALGVMPWLYLGYAVLYAATGAGYPICREDPFVAIFRLGAPAPYVVATALFVGASLFIGRPYCRFFCPYGALLGLMSRVSRRHVSISPAECVHCRLCEDACPYGAIRTPAPAAAPESRAVGARRLALTLALAVPLTLAAAGAGFAMGDRLAAVHPRIALARDVARHPTAEAATGSDARTAFFLSGATPETLAAEARALQRRFAIGGALWAGGLAIALLLRLLGLSLWRSRKDYEPDRAACVSCGRCFAACPVGRKRTPPDQVP